MRPQIWSGLPARSPRRFRLERRFEIRDDKPISEIELRLVEKIGVVLCPRARGEIGPLADTPPCTGCVPSLA